MDQSLPVSFQVTITSTDHASWQGYVEINGTSYEFKSELQLLRCVLEQYPFLHPSANQANTF